MSHHAISDRSNFEKLDVSEISQLPRELFQTMHVVLDAVEVTSDSPFTFDITVAFPLTQQGRPSQRTDFGAQYTAWSFPCQRFALTVAHQDA